MAATPRPTKPKPNEVQSACALLWRGSPSVLAKVWDHCLTEMLTLFYPPDRPDSEVEMLTSCATRSRAYVEDLAEFQPEIIERAWQYVRRRHRVERWPTIAAIRDACIDAQPRRAPSETAQRQDRKLIDRWPYALMATEALATPQGQWCLRNGCGRAYWERIAEGHTTKDRYGNRVQEDAPRDLPDRDEVQAIFDAVQRNQAAMDEGRGGKLHGTLWSLWQARLSREAQFVEKYLAA